MLGVPLFAVDDAWADVASLGAAGAFHVLPAGPTGKRTLASEPDQMEAVCRFDMAAVPILNASQLPDGFWSVALFDRGGRNVYSFNDSSVADAGVVLTVATPAQAATLAPNASENAMVAGLPIAAGMAVLRVFVPDDASLPGVTAALAAASCNAPL